MKRSLRSVDRDSLRRNISKFGAYADDVVARVEGSVQQLSESRL